MIKLSIIIPAYNAENFLPKCLDSCLCQDIIANEYEIIVVDDGSTDRTRQIVDNYQKANANIQYIFQENAKQGAARNNGLSKAQGEYVWFVDADDWITDNCISDILGRMDGQNLTGLLVGHVSHYNTPLVWDRFDEKRIDRGIEILAAHKLYISPTYAVWRKSYLDDIDFSFMEHTYHEDMVSLLHFFYKAERIGYLNKICYHVYINPDSTTRSANPKRAFDLIKICNELNMQKRMVEDTRIRTFLTDYVAMGINMSLYNSFRFDSKQNTSLDVVWRDNRHLFFNLVHSSVLKYKIEGFLFLMFPGKVTKIYKLMQKANRNPGAMNNKKQS